MNRAFLPTLLALFASQLPLAGARAQDFEQAPILYSQSEPNNRASRLLTELKSGKAVLQRDEKFGYLPALLAAFETPVSSQTLVFSKTSLQREAISPRTPRAIYFSDDVFVGYCHNGSVIEIAVADAELGAVFYTLPQDASEKPQLTRQTDNCLICHASSQTKEVPGYVVRSVFADAAGLPILSAGTDRINQTSPLEKRWGGWYVTGTHGEHKHRGNVVFKNRHDADNAKLAAGLNVKKLDDRFDTANYLAPHSDLVALMVLEHQVDALNYLARANFLTRQALHYQATLNRELGEPADHVWDSTKSRVKNAGEPLVEYLLFSEEAQLEHRLQGTSKFAQEFAARGPRDKQGRSLRDFDLERRVFRYPCSYLIYSPTFAKLPPMVKDYVWKRLFAVLSGEDQTAPFKHLSPQDRQAILEILRDTIPDLPDYWRAEKSK